MRHLKTEMLCNITSYDCYHGLITWTYLNIERGDRDCRNRVKVCFCASCLVPFWKMAIIQYRTSNRLSNYCVNLKSIKDKRRMWLLIGAFLQLILNVIPSFE